MPSEPLHRKLLQKGLRYYSKGLTVYALPGIGKHYFIFPKTVTTAVERNRLRRRVKASLQTLPETSSLDLLFRPTSELEKLPFPELTTALQVAIAKFRKELSAKTLSH